MNSTLKPLAKKRTHSMCLFMEAITYRIPLPVTKVIVLTSTTYPVCPRCTLSLDREYMSFCDRCGQRLNWDYLEHAKVVHVSSKEG